MPEKHKIIALTNIQILTPMRRGETGADNLNRILQVSLNKSTYSLKRGDSEYREGYKVMQIKNNYDKEIFNGDIGFVSSVNVVDKKLTVNFDCHKVDYDILELDELVLSHATSIHKSQGAEFAIVIMPFLNISLCFKEIFCTQKSREQKNGDFNWRKTCCWLCG